MDILDTYVKATYPDLRKCINMVQMNCVEGKLVPPAKADTGDADYKIEMVELFKAGKIGQAPKLVCIYKTLMRLKIFTNGYMIILIYLVMKKSRKVLSQLLNKDLLILLLVLDPEINFIPTLIRLARLK